MSSEGTPAMSPKRSGSSLSSSGYSSDGGSWKPDFATPPERFSPSSTWQRQIIEKDPLDYNDSVVKMDRELEKIRTKPSKIVNDSRKFVVIVDMSNFRPEDIQVVLEIGLLTIKAEQETKLDNKTSITKLFTRKFTIPEDVWNAYNHSPSGVLLIT
ncbi:hypothetical protein FO519_003524 [Halicephalobus sp. NKZ332]|nr:hypothetical protein FO519_003524 [Halicephalobus sp. NKZ332]